MNYTKEITSLHRQGGCSTKDASPLRVEVSQTRINAHGIILPVADEWYFITTKATLRLDIRWCGRYLEKHSVLEVFKFSPGVPHGKKKVDKWTSGHPTP
jgi:hypothetical protein